MRRPTRIILLLLVIFLWVFYRSGALERTETRVASDVPGVPDKVSVEYRVDWTRFTGYVRGFLPR